MDPLTGVSARRLARIAGALYLLNVVAGAFAIGFVQGRLSTPDLATTADNIASHQLLYRSGLAAHIVVTLTNVPLALIFYELFKVINRKLALLEAFFVLVATAIEAASLAVQFAPLALLGAGPYAHALPTAQLQALASLPSALADASYDVYTVFFGLDILILAYLVLRSRFLPRVIGALLAVDAAAYLAYSFTDVLSPVFAAHLVPWVQMPAPLAEGGLSLWLLLFGINAARWTATARTASLMPPPQDEPGRRGPLAHPVHQADLAAAAVGHRIDEHAGSESVTGLTPRTKQTPTSGRSR